MKKFSYSAIYALTILAVVCAGCSGDNEAPIPDAIPEDVVQLDPTNLLTVPVGREDIVFDGVVMPGEYGTRTPVSLSYAAGETSMDVSISCVNRVMYLGVVCYDPTQTINVPGLNDKWAPSDGLDIYIDPLGLCLSAITAGVYRVIVTADGGFTVRHGSNDGTWKATYTSFGIKTKAHQLADRYIVEVAIPFSAVGISDLAVVRMALELRATDGTAISRVPMAGVQTDKPYTWCLPGLE